MTTEKGKAWKKRVSNPDYATGWDRIFGKKKCPCDDCACSEAFLGLSCVCDELIDYQQIKKEGDE